MRSNGGDKKPKTRRTFSANAAAAFSYFMGNTSSAAAAQSNLASAESPEERSPEAAGSTGGTATNALPATGSSNDGVPPPQSSSTNNPMHRSHQPFFFSSASADDADPVFSYCLTTSHPDSVLRRNGMIRQEGVYKNKHVYFNPKSCLWHRIDNDEPQPQAMPYFIDDRFDKGPSGVIQIYGTDGVLEHDDISQLMESITAAAHHSGMPNSPTVATPNSSGGGNPLASTPGGGVGATGKIASPAAAGAPMAAQHRENLRMMERYHRTLTHPLGEQEESVAPDGTLQITKAHQKRYIQQYLSRAIPEAAKSANAVIVLTRGNSLVAEQVSNGIASLQRHTRVNIAASSNVVDAVAVTPYREEIDPLHRGLTHHIVLRRSMVSRLPRNPGDTSTVSLCQGWLSVSRPSRESCRGSKRQQLSSPTVQGGMLHEDEGHHTTAYVDIGGTQAESFFVADSEGRMQPNVGSSVEMSTMREHAQQQQDQLEHYEQQTCVFCGELAEWHAPYAVYRTNRVSRQTKLREVVEKFRTAKKASIFLHSIQHSRAPAHEHPPLLDQLDAPAFGAARPGGDPHHIESPEAPAARTAGGILNIAAGASSRSPTPAAIKGVQTPPALDLHYPHSSSIFKSPDMNLFSEEPDAIETDQYVGRLVDQLAVGCRQELLIPGRRSTRTKVAFTEMALLWRRRAPLAPDRNQIPVVVILIGGEPHAAKRYLTQCIARRYTILIVEGSGGYADYLGQMKRRIERAFPFAGRDGILRYSTALDPLTAEILSCFDLVKFIRPGSKNEELTREIDGALKGEGVLSGVWKLYARVQANSKYQARLFALANMFQMLLSLFVTFLTALQTYLLLQMVRKGESVPATFPSPADERGTWFLWKWTAMQWSIIIIPISIAALQAFSVKADYGAKWIALRTMSHRLLSEIYQYRTSCLLYHEGEVERHRASHETSESHASVGGPLGEGGDGEGGGRAGGGGKVDAARKRLASTALMYKSRDDLLQLRAAELDKQTQEGACKQLNLFDDVKTVPPKNILEVDDGFSALTADQYVRVRLRRMIDVYERDALFFTQLLQWCQSGITLANGLGTGLAAVAAFTDGTIQAWLAFTTAFVATLLRVLEGFRLEFQMRKKVQTGRTLLSINAWWGSLRERADNQQNRDWLVEQVETAILDEVDAWAQQFGQALEMMKKGGDNNSGGDGDDGGDKPDGHGGGDDKGNGDSDRGDAPATLKGLELAELSAHSLKRVLMDPTAPTKLKEQTLLKMKNLREKLLEGNGGAAMTSKARREVELKRICSTAHADESILQEGRNMRGEAVSITASLEFPTLEDSIILPNHIENILRNRPLDFTTALKDVVATRRGSTTEQGITSGNDGGDTSPHQSRRDSQRRGSSSTRRGSTVAAKELSAQESVVAASQVSYCDCVMALRSMDELASSPEDLSHRHNLELCKRIVALELINGLTTAVDRFKLRDLCSEGTTVDDLVAQFCSLALTPNIGKFSLSALLQLIRDPLLRNNLTVLPDCESFFHRLVDGCLDAFSSNSFKFAVYQRLCEMIADIDVDLIMSDTSSGVAVARSVETLFRFGIRPWVLQKADLVAAFPETMRPVIESRSHFLLAAYLDQALLSKPSLVSVDHLINRFGTAVFPATFLQFLRSKRENQVVFASIVESLTQADILTKSMHHLTRLIDISFSAAPTTTAASVTAAGGGGSLSNNRDSKLISDMKERLERLPLSNLRLAFSILQTIHSNTYGASIVDRTCDSIVDFSLREIMNYENVVRLVSKLPELKAYNLHQCCHSKKAEVLKIFGVRKLTEALDNLSDAQLRTIFYAFQFANPTDWTLDQVAGLLRAYLDEESEKAKRHFARVSRDTRYRESTAALPTRNDYHYVDANGNAERDHSNDDSTALANFYSEEWVKDVTSWTGKTLLCLLWASAQTTSSKLKSPDGDETGSGANSPRGDSGEDDIRPPTTARTRHRNLEAMLEDAPDAMAKRALKSLDPKRCRDILRLIQPCGVDCDVSRVFGNVVSQGGYDEPHTAALQTAFSRWQVRQASVDAISTMLLYEPPTKGEDINEMDDAIFVQFFKDRLSAVTRVDCTPDVDRKVTRQDSGMNMHLLSDEVTVEPWHSAVKHFGDAQPLPSLIKDYCLTHLNAKGGPPIEVQKDFLSNLMTELRLSAPLLVFYRLASLCTFLDIRELFDTVEQRTELVVLLTLAIMDSDAGTLFTERDGNETRKAIAAMRDGADEDINDADDFHEEESSNSMNESQNVRWQSAQFSLFEYPIFSDISSVDCVVMGLGDGRGTNTLQKGYWRKRVLTAIHYRYEGSKESKSYSTPKTPPQPTRHGDDDGSDLSYGFERVTSLLHNLSEPHLRFLFECQSKALQSTVGRLLQSVVAYKRYGGRERALFRIMRPLSVRDSFVFDIALSNLIRNIKTFPTEMSISLDHLDPQKFATRSETERRTVLSMWMNAGSQGPLDVLLRASTVPSSLLSQSTLLERPIGRLKHEPSLLVTSEDLLQDASAEGLSRTTGSMTYHHGGVFDQQAARLKNGRENLSFLKYIFAMIKSAKPDNNRSSLECQESKNESKLAAIMGRAQGWRVLVTVNRFVNALKRSGDKKRILMPPRASGQAAVGRPSARNAAVVAAEAAVRRFDEAGDSPPRGDGEDDDDEFPLQRSANVDEWLQDSSETEATATTSTSVDDVGSSANVPSPTTTATTDGGVATPTVPATVPGAKVPPLNFRASPSREDNAHTTASPVRAPEASAVKAKSRWAKVSGGAQDSSASLQQSASAPVPAQASSQRLHRPVAVRVVDPMASPKKTATAPTEVTHHVSATPTPQRAPSSVPSAGERVLDDVTSPPSPPPRGKRPAPTIQRRSGGESPRQHSDHAALPGTVPSLHPPDPMLATYSLSSLQTAGTSGDTASAANDNDAVELALHGEEEAPQE